MSSCAVPFSGLEADSDKLSAPSASFTARDFSDEIADTRSTASDEHFSVNAHFLVVTGRNHPLIIGERAVDQL